MCRWRLVAVISMVAGGVSSTEADAGTVLGAHDRFPEALRTVLPSGPGLRAAPGPDDVSALWRLVSQLVYGTEPWLHNRGSASGAVSLG